MIGTGPQTRCEGDCLAELPKEGCSSHSFPWTSPHTLRKPYSPPAGQQVFGQGRGAQSTPLPTGDHAGEFVGAFARTCWVPSFVSAWLARFSRECKWERSGHRLPQGERRSTPLQPVITPATSSARSQERARPAGSAGTPLPTVPEPSGSANGSEADNGQRTPPNHIFLPRPEFLIGSRP